MMLLLVLLVSLTTRPSFCSAPCNVAYKAVLVYPAVRGEMCINLDTADGLEVSHGCRDVEPNGPRVWDAQWIGLGVGDYVGYVTMNGQVVSALRNVYVS